MKVTPLSQSSVLFDPEGAPAGTLMIDAEGDLCMRTDTERDDDCSVVYLIDENAGVLSSINGNGPFTKATFAYRIEND